MCGIVGVVGSGIGVAEEKAFKEMLIYDTVRGKHSTGMFAMDSTGNLLTAKKAVDGSTFVDLGVVDRLFKGKSFKMLVGHNRYATAGAVTDNNAHPFNRDHIHMVHNGSLTTWRNALHDASQTSVDSEAVCFNLAHEGVEETVKKLRGSFSIVAHDATDNSLSFFRNDERPMWMAYAKNKDVLFFASEPWMFEVAAKRNNIALEKAWALRELTQFKVNIDIACKCNGGLTKAGAIDIIDGLEQPAPDYNVYGWDRGSYRGSYRGRGNKSNVKSVVVGAAKSEEPKGLVSLGLSTKDQLVALPIRFELYTSSGDNRGKLHIEIEQPVGKYNGTTSKMKGIIYNVKGKDAKKLIQGKEILYVGLQSYTPNNETLHCTLRGVLTVEEVNNHYAILYEYDEEDAKDELDGVLDGEGTPEKKLEGGEGAPFDTDADKNDPLVKGPDGGYVRAKDFFRLCKDGCANCSDTIFISDAPEIAWVYDRRPLCVGCSSMVQRYGRMYNCDEETALDSLNASGIC